MNKRSSIETNKIITLQQQRNESPLLKHILPKDKKRVIRGTALAILAIFVFVFVFFVLFKVNMEAGVELAPPTIVVSNGESAYLGGIPHANQSNAI